MRVYLAGLPAQNRVTVGDAVDCADELKGISQLPDGHHSTTRLDGVRRSCTTLANLCIAEVSPLEQWASQDICNILSQRDFVMRRCAFVTAVALLAFSAVPAAAQAVNTNRGWCAILSQRQLPELGSGQASFGWAAGSMPAVR